MKNLRFSNKDFHTKISDVSLLIHKKRCATPK